MHPSRIITLTTDFGHDDPFVGVMKGVLLSVNPKATVVDLCHGIPSHDIRAAAAVVGMNYRYFPEGTVHVAVVDPGVGSERRPILAAAGGHWFVGPDNGIFSMVYDQHPQDLNVVHITASRYFLVPDSPTFQGRDLFAPVAARLAAGKRPGVFGSTVDDYVRIRLPEARVSGRTVEGEVIAIDKFGNCMTNITGSVVSAIRTRFPKKTISVSVGTGKAVLRDFYGQAASGTLAALINSSDRLEIFIKQGSAAGKLGITAGQKVHLKVSP